MSEPAVWQSVLGEIELSVSKASFSTWFKQTELLEIRGRTAVVGVPNIFAKQQMQTKFNQQLLNTLQKVGAGVKEVEYVIHSPHAKTRGAQRDSDTDEAAAPDTGTLAKPAVSKKPALGTLNGRYNFETFIVGSSNELAFAAAQAAVKMPGEKCNPLYVYGGVGLGKTHLIQAVGNEIKAAQPDANIIYINSETFVNEFVSSLKQKTNKKFSNHYRSADVLVIDDIQFIAGKERTQEEFFHTFNVLHQANKQVVVSSDKPPKHIAGLEDRLKSRFEWGMAVDMQPPDFETRCAIIDAKAAQHEISLERDTVEYIAQNIQTNIRELEGALNKLITYCEMSGAAPDKHTAAGLIENVKHSRPHHVSARQIIDRTAKFFQLETGDITSARRDKHVAMARQIAMYLLRSELHQSFPKIASELGRKDHTTAIHSVEKIEKGIKLDHVMRQQVAALRERIYG